MRYYAVSYVCTLMLSLLAGYISLPVLKKLNASQTINELGPKTHKAKQGLLTMGGTAVILSGVLGGVAFGFYKTNDHGQLVLFLTACTLCFCFIGFIDDYLKVVKRRSVGLTVKQKLLPQIVFAVLFAIVGYFDKNIGPKIALPLTQKQLNLGILYIPVMAFIVVAIDNSANILDGLDGLLSSNSSIALFCMALYTMYSGTKTDNGSMINAGIFMLCMSAAVFGFLKYNTHPATVILGDVGSLGIGGAIAGAAIISRGVLLIPLVCITMLISSLSDILQVHYMKRHNGRKLMRMSPYHHHLELGGMPETRIVGLYSIITVAGCAAALILFT